MAVDKNAYGCVDENQTFIKRDDTYFVDGEYYVIDVNCISKKDICFVDNNCTSIDCTPNLDLLAQHAIYTKGFDDGMNYYDRLNFCISTEVQTINEKGTIILKYDADNHCLIDPVTGVAIDEDEDLQEIDYSSLRFQNFMESFDRAKKVPLFYYPKEYYPELAKMSDKTNEELSRKIESIANDCRSKLDRQFEKMVQVQHIIASYEQEFEDVYDVKTK
jgi:hypothetical protein